MSWCWNITRLNCSLCRPDLSHSLLFVCCNILLHSDTSFVSVCSLHCFGTEWQDRNVYIIVVCLFLSFFVCLVGYLVGLTTGKVSIVPIFLNVLFWRLGPKKAIKHTTRWRYCVECPQYSIRHEALDVYFLHSTGSSVTWLNSRSSLAAWDSLMSALCTMPSTRDRRRRKFGVFLVRSVQAMGMTLNFFFLAYSQRSQIDCLPYFLTWCGLSALKLQIS